MALDRLLPISTTPGAVDGDAYMDAVQEEVTGLWDRSVITLTSVSGTNTISATATPALTGALGGSMNFILKAAATNSGAVTLNVNGGGAVAVVDAEGTALTAGALRINGNYFLHYDSGISKYVVVNYTPAAAVTVGSKLLRTQAASSSSSLDFVHGASGVVLDDTYDHYELVLSSLVPATDDVELWLRVGTGGGPTYQTTLYSFFYTFATSAGAGAQGGTTAAKIILGSDPAGTGAVGNASGESVNAIIDFANPESASLHKLFSFHGVYKGANASPMYKFEGAGSWDSATAITALRVMFESGNIASGRASLYGITKA